MVIIGLGNSELKNLILKILCNLICIEKTAIA